MSSGSHGPQPIPMAPSKIAERVKAAREGLGISCRELDRRSGLTEGHVSLIERGDRQIPSSTTAVKLAKGLQVDVVWLLTGYQGRDDNSRED